LEYIISGIIGLLTGAIGSLVAPWLKWKIEEKKEERSEKVELIKNLRVAMETAEPNDSEFLNSTHYIRIRPFLSEKVISEIEDSKTIYIEQNSRSYLKSIFLQQLQIIESKWNIGLPKEFQNKKSFEMNRPTTKVSSKH